MRVLAQPRDGSSKSTVALAQRAGLGALVARHLSVHGTQSAHALAKIAAVVARMVAGANSFEDLAVPGHDAAIAHIGGGAPTASRSLHSPWSR